MATSDTCEWKVRPGIMARSDSVSWSSLPERSGRQAKPTQRSLRCFPAEAVSHLTVYLESLGGAFHILRCPWVPPLNQQTQNLRGGWGQVLAVLEAPQVILI